MRKTGLAVCVLISMLAVAGCGKQSKVRASGPARTASQTRVSGSGATGLPDSYRTAVQLYARKDYRGALAIVERLLALPNLTPEKREFLQRQRTICLNPDSSTTGKSESQPTPQTGGAADCGPRALGILLHTVGKDAPTAELARAAGTNRYGTTLAGLEKAAKMRGLKCDPVQMDLNALKQMSGKGIAWVDGDHYVALLSVSGDDARIHDPNHDSEEMIATEELLRRSGGIVLRVWQ